MPININASNYISTNSGASQSVASGINTHSGDGVVVSVKGLDLQSGQTISGQIVEIDGKDIKLLLSNNQTINAKLEGNINALLGQTLSFEVKSSENGQTALRPLYTNLNNSQTVSNALQSAGLPVTDNYAKMVSTMMDEGLPINKGAVYDMSKNINSFPNADPATIVKLNKLGLQINELTINQYDNYKGLEHQIKNDVDTVSKGLTDLIKDSLSETVKNNSITDISTANVLADSGLTDSESVKLPGKNLLTAFLNAISGTEQETEETANSAITDNNIENKDSALVENGTDVTANTQAKDVNSSVFGISKMVLDMVNPSDSDNEPVSNSMKAFASEFIEELKNSNLLSESDPNVASIEGNVAGRAKLLDELRIENNTTGNTSSNENLDIIKNTDVSSDDYSGKQVLALAKEVLDEMSASPEKFDANLASKLTKLLSSKEFLNLTKDNISKQMLLKPEEVVSSKNVEELYSKILKQTNQAVEIMQNAGRENPEVLNAAKNINDNVSFMNELNQVVTYVQLPLLMNNKSAHGDLYVYTNKKSLKNNDGNVSALLHLDMDNLGPMDIYVQLTNGTKLNTHFYLQDEATIDFIEAHIDRLNKRLAEKGYDMNMNVSVKDNTKGATNMADEFLKNDPLEESVTASKFSFDVRA